MKTVRKGSHKPFKDGVEPDADDKTAMKRGGAVKGYKDGGKVSKAGAGSGAGRLEKIGKEPKKGKGK